MRPWSRHRAGFTLVELALVIVILSVIALVALPRFIDLDTQATRATVAGTAGSFQEAVILVRATSIATGQSGPRTNLTVFGDGTVDISSYGFPVDGASNLTSTLMTAARCQNVWNAILQNPPTTTTSGVAYSSSAPQVYRVQHSGTAATPVLNRFCRYTYRPVASPIRRFDYYYNTGRVIVTNP
jgi:MSHA pilin protein MshB